MSRPNLAAALLVVSLAACQGQERRESALPELAATAEQEAPMPESSPEAEGTQVTAAAVRINGKPRESGCGAEKIGKWLNGLPTDEVKADIAKAVGERAIRYYTQGVPITMDFSPARLNVELGEDGRIKLFRCG